MKEYQYGLSAIVRLNVIVKYSMNNFLHQFEVQTTQTVALNMTNAIKIKRKPSINLLVLSVFKKINTHSIAYVDNNRKNVLQQQAMKTAHGWNWTQLADNIQKKENRISFTDIITQNLAPIYDENTCK